jgi:MYXO-CTERM domain-containing protein
MGRSARVALSTAVAAAALWLVAAPAAAAPRSWYWLTTGNGFGFQVYDINQKKITTFLEHPYRFLRAGADPKSDGVLRRNLVYDFYFGVRGPGGTAWLNSGNAATDPEYLDQSHILHAAIAAAGVTADNYYFAPFDYPGNAMVALIHVPNAVEAFALFNFHMGSPARGTDLPDPDGESLAYVPLDNGQQATIETGAGAGAMIYLPIAPADQLDCDAEPQKDLYTRVQNGMSLAGRTNCSGTDVVPAYGSKLNADGWWGVAMQYVDDPAAAPAAARALSAWANHRRPAAILADAQKEFDGWRMAPPGELTLSADELATWRQSEAVLRMAQVREPNTAGRRNHGMILAALPVGEWHTAWVRDMSYSIVALARTRHLQEALDGLDFLMEAGPVGAYRGYVNNQDYRISVCRYYGDGSEQADYSGQLTPNVEVDGWGLSLWAIREVMETTHGQVWLMTADSAGKGHYQTLAASVGRALEGMIEPGGIVRADSSIWEVHDGNKRHFAYSTLTAARGLCDLSHMARQVGNQADQMEFAGKAAQLAAALVAQFPDGDGALAGSIEGLARGVYSDGAVAEALNLGLVDPGGRVAGATLDRFAKLRVQSGGFKRNDDDLSSYDNNEWIFIDLRIGSAMRRAGRIAPANGMIANVVERATPNFYLVPELYQAIPGGNLDVGAYTGAVPMVGFGAGVMLLSLLDRGGALSGNPFDCPGPLAGPDHDGGTIADAGAGDLAAGAAVDGGRPRGRGDGCACSTTARGEGAPASLPFALLAAAFLARAARRRRREAR